MPDFEVNEGYIDAARRRADSLPPSGPGGVGGPTGSSGSSGPVAPGGPSAPGGASRPGVPSRPGGPSRPGRANWPGGANWQGAPSRPGGPSAPEGPSWAGRPGERPADSADLSLEARPFWPEGWPEVYPPALDAPFAEDPPRPSADAPQRKLPEETPVVRRFRHSSNDHLEAPTGRPPRRVGVRAIARRRATARRACPCGWQVRVLGTPPRNRRRLWTKCL